MKSIVRKKSLSAIRNDLDDLKNYAVILFGSYVAKTMTNRSDIDVAVITFDRRPESNNQIFLAVMPFNRPPYDIKIFEQIPLYIQKEIIDNYEILFGDEYVLAEYFYFVRKLWTDVAIRLKRLEDEIK